MLLLNRTLAAIGYHHRARLTVDLVEWLNVDRNQPACFPSSETARAKAVELGSFVFAEQPLQDAGQHRVIHQSEQVFAMLVFPCGTGSARILLLEQPAPVFAQHARKAGRIGEQALINDFSGEQKK